jgi:hypothetical protein
MPVDRTGLVRMDDTYMGIADEFIEWGPYQNEVRLLWIKD